MHVWGMDDGWHLGKPGMHVTHLGQALGALIRDVEALVQVQGEQPGGARGELRHTRVRDAHAPAARRSRGMEHL